MGRMSTVAAPLAGLLVLLPDVAAADPAAGPDRGTGWPECYCTDGEGRRVDLGEEACLSVGGRSFTARCEMSLNVPAWREVRAGCATAPLSLLERLQRLEPGLHAGAVHPHVAMPVPGAREDREG